MPTDREYALVFAPSPLLTVTIEDQGGEPDLHLHAGGQGVWIARMIKALGVPVRLCGSFGGETGTVIRTLIETEGIEVRTIDAAETNAAYVHDRRSGERVALAEMRAAPLARHEVDELYGVALVEGLEASVCVLGGASDPDVVPADIYRRLAHDLAAYDRPVVADLSGERLRAALRGRITAVKVSHEELLRDGWVDSDDDATLVRVMRELHEGGAANVIVSRADLPALALLGATDTIVEIVTPTLEPADSRGAGDSMTAGLAVALARGHDAEYALRLAAAAGCLNVTRRGLATGHRDEIERLVAHVEVRAIGDGMEEAGVEPGPRDADEPGHCERDAVTSPEELAAKAQPA